MSRARLGPRVALAAVVVAVAAFVVTPLLRPPPRVVVERAGDADLDLAGTRGPGRDPGPDAPGPRVPPPEVPDAPDLTVPDGAPPPPEPPPTGPARGVVAGRVRDPAGAVVVGAIVRRAGVKGQGAGRTVTDAAGRFELRGLPLGRHAFEVFVVDLAVRGGGVGVRPFEADAGARDVEVTVDRGLAVTLTWAGEGPPPADLAGWVTRGGGPPRVDPRFDAEGTARMLGFLPADRLTVWGPPDAEGRIVFARDVVPGGPPVALARSPGLAITGRLKGLKDRAAVTVVAEEPDLSVRVLGTVRDDGELEVRGLPAGTKWRVEAALTPPSEDDPVPRVVAEGVTPGGRVDLDLAEAR